VAVTPLGGTPYASTTPCWTMRHCFTGEGSSTARGQPPIGLWQPADTVAVVVPSWQGARGGEGAGGGGAGEA
jgi:hypothetical protein